MYNKVSITVNFRYTLIMFTKESKLTAQSGDTGSPNRKPEPSGSNQPEQRSDENEEAVSTDINPKTGRTADLDSLYTRFG